MPTDARTAILAEISNKLRDTNNTVFTTTIINATMDTVVREISVVESLLKRIFLPVTAYSKEISLSSLTDMIDNPVNVYFPANQYGMHERNFQLYGSMMSLTLSNIPTIKSGALTGTVTFVKDSRTVTGAGTLFLSELQASSSYGYLIAKKSTTKYYQIAEIISNTELRLFSPWEETGATDTINSTLYTDEYGCAVVVYGGVYTCDENTMNVPTHMKNALIYGTISQVCADFVANETRTIVAQVDTDLDSGRVVINTINPAGDIAGRYADYAKTLAAEPNLLASYRDLHRLYEMKYQKELDSLGRLKSHCVYYEGL